MPGRPSYVGFLYFRRKFQVQMPGAQQTHVGAKSASSLYTETRPAFKVTYHVAHPSPLNGWSFSLRVTCVVKAGRLDLT